jgi:hypothetical protein
LAPASSAWILLASFPGAEITMIGVMVHSRSSRMMVAKVLKTRLMVSMMFEDRAWHLKVASKVALLA